MPREREFSADTAKPEAHTIGSRLPHLSASPEPASGRQPPRKLHPDRPNRAMNIMIHDVIAVEGSSAVQKH
jgi:hypothetical protein